MNTFLLLIGVIATTLATNTDGSSPSSPGSQPAPEHPSDRAASAQEAPDETRPAKSLSDSPPADSASRSPNSGERQIFHIAENSARETVVGTVRVPGNTADATVRYEIVSGNESGAFAIDSATGRLTVKNAAALDHETTSRFRLTVQATIRRKKDATIRDSFAAELLDAGFDRTTVGELLDKHRALAVFIEVDDANEPPVLSRRIVEIDENLATGAIVTTVPARDPDRNDELHYAVVGGNSGDAFGIDPQTGMIAVAEASGLDFESQPHFALRVEVRDADGQTSSETIEIRLRDVNESPRLDDLSLKIAEDASAGVVVGTAAALDADAQDELHYEIVSGDVDRAVAIDAQSGQITLVHPDALRTAAKELELVVRVRDLQGANDTARVRIENSIAHAEPALPVAPRSTGGDAPSHVAEPPEATREPAPAAEDGNAGRDAAATSGTGMYLGYGLSLILLGALGWVTCRWRRTLTDLHRVRTVLKLERRSLSKEIEELNQECDRLLEANELLAGEIKKTADMRRQLDAEQKKLGELRERLDAQSQENAALEQELDQQTVRIKADRDALYEIQLRLQLQHADLLEERRLLDAERGMDTHQPIASQALAVVSCPPAESSPAFETVTLDAAEMESFEFHEEYGGVNLAVQEDASVVYVAGDEGGTCTLPAFHETLDGEERLTEASTHGVAGRESSAAAGDSEPQTQELILNPDAQAKALRAQLEELFGVASRPADSHSAEPDNLPALPDKSGDLTALLSQVDRETPSTLAETRDTAEGALSLVEAADLSARGAHSDDAGSAPDSEPAGDDPFARIQELIRASDESDGPGWEPTPSAEEIQPSEPAPEEDENYDVNAYMEQLLGRVRRNRKGWQESSATSTEPQSTSAAVLPIDSTPGNSDTVEEPELEPVDPAEAVSYSPVPPVPHEPPPPVHRQDKSVVLENTLSLRELANIAARSAVSRYTTRKKRRKSVLAWVLATASFGLAAVLLSGTVADSTPTRICGWISGGLGVAMIARLIWLSTTGRRSRPRRSSRPTLQPKHAVIE